MTVLTTTACVNNTRSDNITKANKMPLMLRTCTMTSFPLSWTAALNLETGPSAHVKAKTPHSA